MSEDGREKQATSAAESEPPKVSKAATGAAGGQAKGHQDEAPPAVPDISDEHADADSEQPGSRRLAPPPKPKTRPGDGEPDKAESASSSSPRAAAVSTPPRPRSTPPSPPSVPSVPSKPLPKPPRPKHAGKENDSEPAPRAALPGASPRLAG